MKEYIIVDDTWQFIVHEDGSEGWTEFIDGRETGVHISKFDGGERWYLNGELHRTDGPAIIWPDGYKEWWIHGLRYRSHELSSLPYNL